ncbi:alpha/beta hydrolase [Burkholderia sp. AU45388]|nr:alpha/beta hydrolase [Burkholderia sp. AU45388]MDN7426583.1 alpha/beta hydrolase [Burkholderia sp. AU45388]
MPNTFHRVGDGPHPVLVLHGWFGDAHAFEPLEAWLSRERFSYVFMDYRGYGRMRDARGDYTIDEIAADTLALADALGFPTFSLVGHSMGGMAIEKIAAIAPDRVRALVAIAPVPCGGLPFEAERRHYSSGPPITSPIAGPSSTAAPATGCPPPGSSGKPRIRPPVRRRGHSARTSARGPIRISARRSRASIR